MIFTIIISASPLWWWVSTKRIGRAMIVIVIRPALSCVFRVVSRCNHSNGAGNRLGPRGILLRRVRWCRHRHIGTLQVISFTLKLWSFPMLCFRDKKKKKETKRSHIYVQILILSQNRKHYWNKLTEILCLKLSLLIDPKRIKWQYHI